MTLATAPTQLIPHHPLWDTARACTACELRAACEGPVPGEGYPWAQLLILGEAPGRQESRDGRPFIGAAGQELNNYLRLYMELTREAAFITNTTLCRPGQGSEDWKPQPAHVRICTTLHLEPTLWMVRPKVVLALGAVAIGYLLGIPTDKVVVRELSGIPQRPPPVDGLYRDFILIPSIHPAAPLRREHEAGPMMRAIGEAFQAARGVLEGTWQPVIDEHPAPSYALIDSLRELGLPSMVAVDTERLPSGKPWCLSASAVAGVALVVKADDYEGISAIKSVLENPGVTTVFHNSAWDLAELAHFNPPIYPANFRDTMYQLYWRGEQIQGLKHQARRLLGMEMQDYTDVVRTAQGKLAMEYLGQIASIPWPAPQPIEKIETRKPKYKKDKATGQRVMVDPGGGTEVKVKHPWNMARKAAGILKDAKGKGADPVERWRGLEEEERALVENVLGRMPEAGLDQVEESVWVPYSARDADATLRLYLKLAGGK